MSATRKLPILAAALVITAGLAGCVGGDDTTAPTATDASDAVAWPTCAHPWPCADGSEWPSDLVAPDHPRQPAVLPASLSMDGAATVASTDSNATFEWRRPSVDATDIRVDGVGGTDILTVYEATSIEVPAGLYLRWHITMRVEGGEDGPVGRSFDLALIDADGRQVCFADIDLTVAGQTTGDDVVGCTTDTQLPLEDAQTWTVDLQHEHDRADGAEIVVTVDVQLAEPKLAFGLAELRHLRLPGHDGTELDGYVYLPDVPDGVKVPTVLWVHPYFEQTKPAADSDAIYTDSAAWGAGLDFEDLVDNGYAVAAYSVRGSGSSDGCFDQHGPAEQKDMAALVEQLAAMEWSNGRVGMIGLSYHGTTPWEAAIHGPPALKTIVVAGMISDYYTFYHTPQGAVFTQGAVFEAQFDATVTGPPVLGRPPADRQAMWATRAPERACPELVEAIATPTTGTATDDRNAAYWDERRLIDHFDNVRAAVLLTHGFQDQWNSGHQNQEAFVWNALPAETPKWQVEGQWQHEFPDQNRDDLLRRDDFGAKAMAWLDFWLKGVGDPPAQIGTVEYQDATGDWHNSTAWPPAESREEVLYLAGDDVRPTPGEANGVFLSIPDRPASQVAADAAGGFPGPICPAVPAGTLPGGTVAPVSILYASAPVEQRVVVAGNPYAFVTITSDQPGGLVALTLLDLGPDFTCETLEPADVRAWAQGVADLRFHEGNFMGTDFPVDAPTKVRIDIVNIAEVLEPGHRLGVLASYGDPRLRTGQPYAPTITILADGGNDASHVVLPIVEGTLGGSAPALDYPPRPFVPAAPSENKGDPERS